MRNEAGPVRHSASSMLPDFGSPIGSRSKFSEAMFADFAADWDRERCRGTGAGSDDRPRNLPAGGDGAGSEGAQRRGWTKRFSNKRAGLLLLSEGSVQVDSCLDLPELLNQVVSLLSAGSMLKSSRAF